MCVFYAWRDAVDVLGEREFDDGDIGVVVVVVVLERRTDGRGVCRGGEDGDGDGSTAEEAGEVEERDGVALGHEWEDHEVWPWKRAHSLCVCFFFSCFEGYGRSSMTRQCSFYRYHVV